MSLLSLDEMRVGLCPDRLITTGEIIATGDPIAALEELAGKRAMTVILSSHFARYCLLSSTALKAETDWLAYARHVLATTYGAEAASWEVRVSRTDARDVRIACAIDATLAARLKTLPGLRSVQPYLMAAFNARRRTLAEASAWFVLHEPGRLTIALLESGAWRAVRVRQAADGWQTVLPVLLDREAAIAGVLSCQQLFLCCEQEVGAELGRFRVTDITLPRGASNELRPYQMTLH